MAPEIPRPYVVFQWVGKKRTRVVPTLVRSGVEDRRIDIEIPFAQAGAVQLGGTEPMLSWDANWLAYLDRGGIKVRRTDGSSSMHVLEQEAGREVYLLLTAFSPDGQTLLFHQAPSISMEDGELPSPEGFVPGFVRFDLVSGVRTPIPHLTGFDAWTQDGRGVFFVNHQPRPPARLEVLDLLEPKDPVVLQVVEEIDAFGQPNFPDDGMVCVRSGQVTWTRLDGSEPTMLSSKAPFATHQSPMLSPSRTWVAYQQGRWDEDRNVWAQELRGEGVEWLWRCQSRCTFAWLDDQTLLVLEDGVLWRTRGEGEMMRLASNVAGFAMAGSGA